MKKKRGPFKKLTPMPAAAAVFALAASGAHATLTPVFSAGFPTSWNGTSTTVLDESTAGNTGFQSGSATFSTLAVPPGAAPGSGSMVDAGAGGIKVTGTGSFPTDAILNNAAVAAAGGFTYNIEFLWNGTATPATQKLIDYAGTESLQLTSLTANTSATLGMAFGTGNGPTDVGGTDVDVVSTTILPNTWYNVTMTFITGGNQVVNGDVAGEADLYVNGVVVGKADTVKGTYGDSLNRPIAIGELAYGHTTSILGLTGDIYDASIQLGSVPEPSTVTLGAMGGLGFMSLMWKRRRQKS